MSYVCMATPIDHIILKQVPSLFTEGLVELINYYPVIETIRASYTAIASF
jgi:hypothetical protein